MPVTHHAGAASGVQPLAHGQPDRSVVPSVSLSAQNAGPSPGVVRRGEARADFAPQLSAAQLFLLRLLAAEAQLPAASEPIDWPAVTEAAARLGCLPRLAAVYLDEVCAAAPAATVEQWTAARHSTAARNLLLAHEEQTLLAEFAAKGIPAMPLKGVSLARVLHGDPAARVAVDIDFAIHPAHIAAAAGTLRDRGYRVRLPDALLRHAKFIGSVAPKNAEATAVREHAGMELLVELHWKILPLPDKLVWRELHHYESADVRALPPDLYFLYLCEHLAGHGWGGLRWLCDAADFLRRFAGQIDATSLARLAAAAGLRRATGITLELLDAYFGISWAALDSLRDPATRRHATRFLLRPLHGEPAQSIAARHREQLGLQDDAGSRMKYLWRLAQPTHVEWLAPGQTGGQQVRSAPAAWAVRAARLAGFGSGGAR